MAYDPWGSAGWSVNLVVMPVRGMCRWDRRTILLDIRLGRVEERCTLGHEIVYTERDSLPRWLTAREKAAIDADVACRFSLDALGDALAWSPHPAVVALTVLTDSEALSGPGNGAKPGPTRGSLSRCQSSAYRPARPRKVGLWGTSGLRNRLFRTRRRGGQPVFEGREHLGFAGMRALALLEAV